MLGERILKTLQFFVLQKYPVTLLELHRFLVSSSGESNHESVSVADTLAALDTLENTGKVIQTKGYYTLPGHESLFDSRWRGYQYGVGRERIIRRTMQGLAYIPFVRGVALAGSQALGLQKAESDIDLLVITEPGWLWLPRTLVTAYFQILGVRRYGTKVANRVCLNHYLSGSKAMQVRNWYTALEYSKLRPLMGAYAVAVFQGVNKQWIEHFFPHADTLASTVEKPPRVQRVLEKIFANGFGRGLERVLGRWQARRIHKDEPHIIVESDELSFHPHSKQDTLLEAFK